MRKRAENQAWSLFGLQIERKHSRENGDACKHSKVCVHDGNAGTAFGNVFPFAQITAVGNSDAHAKAQRIKNLSQSSAYRGERETLLFGGAGKKHKFQSFRCTGKGHISDNDNEQKQKKELAAYEKQLSDSTARLNSLLQDSSYITQQQFDLEMSIYRTVWKALFELMSCKERVLDFKESNPRMSGVSNENDLRKRRQADYQLLTDKLREYEMTVDANAPFYKKDAYELMKEIASEFRKIGDIFAKYKDEIRLVDSEEGVILDQTSSIIDGKRDQLVEMVRTYLQSLKCMAR